MLQMAMVGRLDFFQKHVRVRFAKKERFAFVSPYKTISPISTKNYKFRAERATEENIGRNAFLKDVDDATPRKKSFRAMLSISGRHFLLSTNFTIWGCGHLEP